jgi:hypothetical protein
MIPAPSGSHLLSVLNVLKLMGKKFIDPKRSEILSGFLERCKLPFFAKTAPCPFPQEALISLPS